MFSLESLKNLANNGRVSPVAAKLAGVLGIRVVGRASDHGELEPMDKCRGEKKDLLLKEYGEADIGIGETFGLCSYYAEQGGLVVGFER